MAENRADLFLNRKPVKIMISLRQQTTENYASSIAKQADSTYSHTIKLLHKMEDFGLVESQKQGRKKIINLTEDGQKIAKILHKLIKKL